MFQLFKHIIGDFAVSLPSNLEEPAFTTTTVTFSCIQSIGLFLVLEVFQQCSSSPGAAEHTVEHTGKNSQLHGVV